MCHLWAAGFLPVLPVGPTPTTNIPSCCGPLNFPNLMSDKVRWIHSPILENASIFQAANTTIRSAALWPMTFLGTCRSNWTLGFPTSDGPPIKPIVYPDCVTQRLPMQDQLVDAAIETAHFRVRLGRAPILRLHI
jgi:hypothetical protein